MQLNLKTILISTKLISPSLLVNNNSNMMLSGAFLPSYSQTGYVDALFHVF